MFICSTICMSCCIRTSRADKRTGRGHFLTWQRRRRVRHLCAERSPSYHFLEIGIEAYRSEGILNFLQDRYYVKLSGSGPGANDLLQQFARVLSQRIAGTRSWPPLLKKIPQEHRVKYSEQFTRRTRWPLLPEPAYIVSYKQGAAESKLLISVAKDPAEAKIRLEALAKYFRGSGKCEAAPIG